MSQRVNNLPSSTITKNNAFGGQWGGAMMTPPFFTNDVEDMLDLKRMKTDIVNDDDISAMMKKTTDLLNEKKSNVEVRIMYTCYQNL